MAMEGGQLHIDKVCIEVLIVWVHFFLINL